MSSNFVCQFDSGNDVIDFVNDPNFALGFGFMPQIARRSQSRMGGRSSYNDVVERLRIKLKGDRPDELLRAADRLAAVLDQANRFQLAEDVLPVVWRLRMPHSRRSSPLTTLLLGTPVDAAMFRSAQDLILRTGNFFEDVSADGRKFACEFDLDVVRRGAFYDGEIEVGENVIGASTTDPVTLSFPPATALSPHSVSYLVGGISGLVNNDGYLVVGNADHIELLTTADYSGAGSNTGESGVEGGNIRQVTNSVITEQSITVDVADTESPGRYYLLAKIEVSGSGATWAATAMGQTRTLEAGRKVYRFGPIFYPFAGITATRLVLQASASGGGSTVSVGSMLFVRSSDEVSIIRASLNVSGGIVQEILFDPSPLTLVSPLIMPGNEADEWRGDPYIEIKGGSVFIHWFAVSSTTWSPVDGVTDPAVNIDCTRWGATLVPQ